MNNISRRQVNERKFGSWDVLPNGGRRYSLDVTGKHGWKARYVKESTTTKVFSGKSTKNIRSIMATESPRRIDITVTRKILVDKLVQYINRQIDLASLVSWSEDMIQEAELDEKDFSLLRDILSRIGLADVREFGLSWDDCYDYLHRLGFDVKVQLQEVG